MKFFVYIECGRRSRTSWLPGGLGDVPRDETDLPPTLAQVIPHLDELHAADYYNFGIGILLDGLRDRVAENQS